MATPTIRSTRAQELAILVAAIAFTPNAIANATPQRAAADPPRRVVVLPVDGDKTLGEAGRDRLRTHLGGLLAARGYEVLDDERVDTELARHGCQPWKASWLPSTATLAELARGLGADGAVVLSGFRAASTNAIVYADRSVEGHVSLLDARSGKVVASHDVRATRSCSVIVDAGQIAKAVSDTVDNGSDCVLESLTVKAALVAAEKLPTPPKRTASGPRPKVAEVVVRRESAARKNSTELAAGDSIEIRARGTLGGRAVASLPGYAGAIPLTENAASGDYRGRVRIEPGSGQGNGMVVVTIFDAAGRSSEPRASESEWRLAAPRVDRTAGVVAVVKTSSLGKGR